MAVLDTLKNAATVLRAADKIPEYEAVLDAYSKIAELQATTYDQQLRIQSLTADLESIRSDQKSAEGAQIWANALWIPNDDNPYCIHCLDKQKRLFHLIETFGKSGVGKIGQCPECRAEILHFPRNSYWKRNATNGHELRGFNDDLPLPSQNAVEQELFTLDYGQMNATLGTELPFTGFNNQTTVPLAYVDTPTGTV